MLVMHVMHPTIAMSANLLINPLERVMCVVHAMHVKHVMAYHPSLWPIVLKSMLLVFCV